MYRFVKYRAEDERGMMDIAGYELYYTNKKDTLLGAVWYVLKDECLTKVRFRNKYNIEDAAIIADKHLAMELARALEMDMFTIREKIWKGVD